MQRSTERFLTTHVGSLPRPDDLVRAMFAQEEGVPVDRTALAARVRTAVEEVVTHQREAGIDLVNDGEISKPSYASYPKYRLSGFDGESVTFSYRDLDDFPAMAQRVMSDPGRSRRRTPACTGPIAPTGDDAVHRDVDSLLAASPDATGRFLTAASPGLVALFFDNQYYRSYEDYLFAVVEAMRPEYEAIASAGITVQLDCPDLAMGRHVRYADLSDEQFLTRVRQTSRPSTTPAPASTASCCACTCAGGTTTDPTIATSRSPPWSTTCCAPVPRRSPSRPPTRATPTSSPCSTTSASPRARS